MSGRMAQHIYEADKHSGGDETWVPNAFQQWSQWSDSWLQTRHGGHEMGRLGPGHRGLAYLSPNTPPSWPLGYQTSQQFISEGPACLTLNYSLPASL